MKLGILWTDGTVVRKENVTDLMFSFINGKRFQQEFAGFGPVRLVRMIDNEWVPFEPTPEQIKKMVQAAYTWQMYNQSRADMEKALRQ